MHNNGIDYDAIQRRVTRRVQRRFRFWIHTAVFFMGVPIFGGFESANFFILWTAGWLFHLIYMLYQNNLEVEIDEEIEREYERGIKRKRDEIDIMHQIPEYDEEYYNGEYHERPQWLGDDGEIVGYDYDYDGDERY